MHPTLRTLETLRPTPPIVVMVDINGRAQAAIEGGGWIVTERTGAPRAFRSLDAAAGALRRAGIRRFSVSIPQPIERTPR